MKNSPDSWGLTPRERETLTAALHVGVGAATATALGISDRTLERHMASIRSKSGLCTSRTLIAWDRYLLRSEITPDSIPVDVQQQDGYVYRAYADGRRTYEAPATVIRAFGMRAFKAQIAQHERGLARRKKAALLRQHVLARLAEGWKPLAIAHEAGVTEARVNQLKQETQ